MSFAHVEPCVLVFLHINPCSPDAHIRVSKEFSFVCFNGTVLQDRIVLLLVERTWARSVSWHWSVKRVESMALNFRHDEEESDTETAGSEGP
jgi:hypothetical protein